MAHIRIIKTSAPVSITHCTVHNVDLVVVHYDFFHSVVLEELHRIAFRYGKLPIVMVQSAHCVICLIFHLQECSEQPSLLSQV